MYPGLTLRYTRILTNTTILLYWLITQQAQKGVAAEIGSESLAIDFHRIVPRSELAPVHQTQTHRTWRWRPAKSWYIDARTTAVAGENLRQDDIGLHENSNKPPQKYSTFITLRLPPVVHAVPWGFRHACHDENMPCESLFS